MFGSTRILCLAVAALSVAGCAGRPAPVVVTLAPPRPVPVAVAAAPLPPGASPGMTIPAMLADGSYPTPSRGLSAAGSVWHLRAALNVAALACRDAGEPVRVAAYNAMLARHRAPLAAAEARLSAEYRLADPVAWQDRYDDAMTRLYNFYGQAPARAGFCRAADAVLADAAVVPAAELDAFAAARLPAIDAAFTDFFRAYDAWRGRGFAPRQVIALSAVPAPIAASPHVSEPLAEPAPAPRLELDARVLAGR